MRRGGRGFSLMEVMVAMAILAGALVGLTLGISRSVRTSHHARLMTQATFLCRQQLVEQEEEFVVNGFTDDALIKEDKGDFEDPAFKRFHWTRTIERIRLPSVDQLQSAATKMMQDKQQIGAGDKPQAPGASGAGKDNSPLGAGMNSLLGPIKDTLEQGIRRVTMRVLWDEPGNPNQSVEVITYYTDMRKLQMP